MSQRVDYEALPGTRYDQYVPKLRAIAQFVGTAEGRQFKPFRDFVRRQGLWDKAKSVTMFSLIDLSWDRQQVLKGGLAGRIESASSDDEVRELLFERLRKDNLLLLKYVLEALDVESGGRLHSVHELYRMVTSYVYPGEYVTLPNFQAWMEWLAATGLIKMVGIRWGLSERGLAVIQEFTSLDVEEILEDMAEEALEAATRSEVIAADEGVESVNSEPEEDAENEGPEDILDGVMSVSQEPENDPEEESASEVNVAPRARGKRTAHVGTTLHPQGLAIARVSGPASTASAGQSLPAVTQPEPSLATLIGARSDMKAMSATIRGWYEQWRGWPTFSAALLGVDTGPEGQEGDTLLAELAILALLIEGLPVQPQLLAAARRIRQSGFFDALHSDGGFSAALDALGDVDDEPWLRAACARLVHAHGIKRRLASGGSVMASIEQASTVSEALHLLRDRVFGGATSEAPFWVIRELVRDGIIDGVKFAPATVVPTARLLNNAARIGLIPRAQISSFEGLIEASACVAEHFGPETGYGEALELLDRGLGLSNQGA